VRNLREELTKKVNKSIERLKAFEPSEGYYLAFSGGKDSCVCKALLDMAGCKYDAHYRVVGIDPPELVRFIKKHHPDVDFEYPRNKDGKVLSMWTQIVSHKIPPTRLIRYCCKDLKEGGGDGRMLITGVRWEESSNRSNNQGAVTIFDKKAKEFENNPNFRLTNKGGWF